MYISMVFSCRITYATAAGETSNSVICTSVTPCSPLVISYFIANVLYCSSNSALLALIISLIIYVTGPEKTGLIYM